MTTTLNKENGMEEEEHGTQMAQGLACLGPKDN
jgi:hypothetical protein